MPSITWVCRIKACTMKVLVPQQFSDRGICCGKFFQGVSSKLVC